MNYITAFVVTLLGTACTAVYDTEHAKELFKIDFNVAIALFIAWLLAGRVSSIQINTVHWRLDKRSNHHD